MADMERLQHEMMRRARAAEEQMVRDILYGGVTAVEPQPPSISADDLMENMRRIALAMPKQETWLSTKLYPPGDQSLRVEASGENFLVAHPSFWEKFQYIATREQAPNPFGNPLVFSGIPILEIDLIGDEEGAQREYIKGIWERLIDAIKVATVELPDWLKAAPKFGVHQ